MLFITVPFHVGLSERTRRNMVPMSDQWPVFILQSIVVIGLVGALFIRVAGVLRPANHAIGQGPGSKYPKRMSYLTAKATRCRPNTASTAIGATPVLERIDEHVKVLTPILNTCAEK